MMQIIAIGLAVLALWRCTCNRWVYVGWQPPATERREFRRWQAAKQARAKKTKADGEDLSNTVPAGNGTLRHRHADKSQDSGDDADDDLAMAAGTGIDTGELPCDRTIWCCCLWPLCWRGKFSPGILGTLASLWCRIARLFVCGFGLLMLLAGIGAIAALAAGASEYQTTGGAAGNRTLVQIWEDNVARIQAERLRHGQL